MSVKIRDKKVSNNSSSAWERVTAGTVITEEKNIIGKLSPPKRQQPIRSHGEGTFPKHFVFILHRLFFWFHIVSENLEEEVVCTLD